MNFELSEEICNQIIFAMEDQKNAFVFDSKSGLPVAKETVQNYKSDRYYDLPVWGSLEGFRLMERFVSLLHNPLAREDLHAVLVSGHGVFRNYKNVLKQYPEVERLWFLFKEKEMKHEIYSWYNVLRNSWGLEKIGDIPEETTEELPAYFSFELLETEEDFKKLQEARMIIEKEFSERFEGEIGKAASEIWHRISDVSDPKVEITIFVQSIGNDFSAAITVSPCPKNAIQTVVVTSFFVLPRFRGLGLGKELLHQCFNKLRENGIRYVLMPYLTIPSSFIPALLRCGFTQNCGGFIADLYSEVTE